MASRSKGRIIIITTLIVVVSIFYWIYSHGTIELNIQNLSSGKATYTLISQQNDKSKTIQTDSPTVRIRVPSGSYELAASQGNRTAYLIARSGHFLKTEHHNISLSAESGVMFVGDNPAGCMIYTGRLYSFNCGQSLYDSITLHVPATKSTPTYTTKINYGLEPLILGAINVGKGAVLLARSVDIEAPTSYSLIMTDGSLAPIKQTSLSLKAIDSGYSILPYLGGFIVYANDYSYAEIFSTSGQNPVKVTFESPHQQGLTALGLTADSRRISVLYTNGPNAKNPVSEIVSYGSGRFNHYDLSESVTKAMFCGTQKICALTGGDMKVFSLNGQQAASLYTLSGVKSISLIGSHLLLVNGVGVIDWNVDAKTGHIAYDWGDYTYQSLQPAPDGYLLNLSDIQGSKRALLVNSASITDGIDKKIAQLQTLPQVSGVSIYKDYIYITPNMGPLVYSKETNSYAYDPVVKRSVNSKINAEVEKLGINTKKYTVINTSE